MPGLTIATEAGSRSNASRNPQNAASPEPTRPPISPITPTLGPAQIPPSLVNPPPLPSLGAATAPTPTPASTAPTSSAPSSTPQAQATAPNHHNASSSSPNATTTRTTTTTSTTSTSTLTSAIPPFAQGRPALTHSQPDQTAIPPPPPVPVSLDDNPDALALRSAISILQLQRARATRDIQALARAKEDALADTGAFAADLRAGRVRAEGDPLFGGSDGGPGSGGPGSSYGSDDSSSSSSNEDDKDGVSGNWKGRANGDKEPGTSSTPSGGESSSSSGSSAPQGTGVCEGAKQRGPDGASSSSPSSSSSLPPSRRNGDRKRNRNRDRDRASRGGKSWQTLPKPQNVVRCPPVNWAQYAVVGESLDRLHAEQLRAPTLGQPAVLGPRGTYEFKGERAPREDEQTRLVGVAAPYAPGRDKIDKKPRGAKK